MSFIDRKEEIANSDYLLYKNTRGRQFRTAPSARIPSQLDKDANDKGIILSVSPTPSDIAAK